MKKILHFVKHLWDDTNAWFNQPAVYRETKGSYISQGVTPPPPPPPAITSTDIQLLM